MNNKKWEEKLNEKQKEEMQKYTEFNKDNFKGVEHFSEIFSRIFNFFRFSVLGICILAIIIGVLIYLGFIISLKAMYM